MASQGPLTGSTASVATGVGNDYDWDFPGNAAVEDGGIAQAILECTVTYSGRSFYLDSTGHGFTIPAGATINGILVEIKRRAGSTQSTISDSTLRLLKAGVPAGSDKASGSLWPNSLTFASYGGAADLWGTTWSQAEINAANFGTRLQAVDLNCDVDAIPPDFEHFAYVDCMRITVTYTPAPAGGAPRRTIMGVGA